VRFVDFLRATVLLSAAAATALAAICVVVAAAEEQLAIAALGVGWWAVSAILGARMGRSAQTTAPIAKLLAGARSSTTLPEVHPSAILLNRLWPLLLFAVVAGVLGLLAPQIPGIAAGFAVIWALAWRHQDAAVQAIEDRDGVCFYVQRASPVRPMSLIRAPGFRSWRPEQTAGTAT